MRIMHIVPGSGGSFYCQNCIRDIEMVKVLRAEGHDAVIVPMYLPLSAEEPTLGEETPVFYGAVRLYLEQRFPALCRMPGWAARALDALPVLKWAARKAGSTRASGLEEMTLSMLKGEEGRQSAELDRLVAWLRSETRPDIIHLSNALLLGLARRLRSELDVPLICSLQDEDAWIDVMREPYREQVWSAMADRARDVDAFTAVSRHFADRMVNRMALPRERVHVVPMGMNTSGYEPAATAPEPAAIGYLSRQSRALGLGILADAFILLKKDARFKMLRLRITGGRTGDDVGFGRSVRRKLAAAGFLDDVDFVERFGGKERVDFIRSLTLLSVPAIHGEAFGMFQIESMACAVPVVQPTTGAFPEVIDATGGGVLYEPNTPDALAAALAALLTDSERRRELGERGRQSVLRHFTMERMAQETLKVYGTVKDGLTR